MLTVPTERWLDLRETCGEFLDNITRLDGSSEQYKRDRDQIRRVMRKITVISALGQIGQNVISIAGLQGSGKTTLIKGLFHLDDSILKAVSGRGERLPILISEKHTDASEADGDNAPEARRQKFVYNEEAEKWSMEVEDIDPSRLSSIAADGDTATMLLELKVPSNLFASNVSFLLLPGFEGNEDEHEALIEFSISCSGTCVYVVSQSINAREDNAERLQKLDLLFEGKKPIYALSFSDITNDNNANFKETFIGEHPGLGADRVICVGRGNEDAWIGELTEAIRKYAYSDKKCVESQQRYIIDTLLRDLLDLKNIALRYKRDEQLRSALEDDQYLKWLEDAFQARKKDIQEELEKPIKTARDKSLRSLGAHWPKDNRLDRFRIMLFGEGVKDIEGRQELIRKAIESGADPVDQGSGTAPEHFASEAAAPQKLPAVIGVENALKEYRAPALTENQCKDIRTLVSPQTAGGGKISLLNSDDIAPVLKGVANMASYTFLNRALQEWQGPILDPSGKNAPEDRPAYDPYPAIKSGDKALLSVLGIAAVDFLPDQEFDLLSSLAKSLEVPTPVAAAVAGVAALAAVGVDMTRETNRLDVKNYFAAQNTISQYYAKKVKSFMKSYSRYTDAIKEQIKDNLISMYGLNRGSGQALNTYIIIHNLEEEIDVIRKELRSQRSELG